MTNSVAIIGLGSLGSFFADNISKLPGLELLVLVDFDVVEEKNIKQYLVKRLLRNIVKFLDDLKQKILKRHQRQDLRHLLKSYLRQRQMLERKLRML